MSVELDEMDDPAYDDDEDLFFRLRAVWHVRHADGTIEDIVLDHGNIVEDATGTSGQVLFEWAPTHE